MTFETEVSSPIVQQIHGPGRGGDMILQPGQRHPTLKSVRFDGRFILKMADGKEFMRVEPTGDVFVWGNKVDSDRKVYESFREWVGCAAAAMGWQNRE